MKLGRSRWFVAAIMLAGTVSPLWATAKFDGTVQDATGAVVPGVHVTVTSPGLGKFHKETETNKKGRFTVLVIDISQQYRFQFEKEGYPSFERTINPSTGTNRELFFFPGTGARAAQSAAAAAESVGMGKAGRAYNAGADALAAGDLDTAKVKFAEAAEADPNLVQAPLALAKVYAKEKNHAQAAVAAEKVLELSPGDIDALTLRYDAYRAMGDKAQTLQALDGLMAAPGGDQGVAVRVFNAGVEAQMAGDSDRARTIFESLIATHPGLAPPHAALSAVLENQQDHAGALAASDAALQLEPGNVIALKVQHEAYKALGETAKADEAWQALAASDPSEVVDELATRGGNLFNEGRVDEAKAAYEAALELDPEHARSHYMLGMCLVNSGDQAMAKEHLSRFLELTPDDPDATTAKATLEYLD